MARDTLPDMSLAEPDLPKVGDLFADRYRLEAQLGRGSRGWAYRAHDVEVGEIVALDLFRVVDDEALERVRRQVRLARRVTHRNVARTYDLGEHAGLRYLTTEYVDGVTVHERIGQATRPAEAVAVALQIAAGLAAMHAAEVVHRELTPSCILIESGGRVVITDFSSACTSGEASDDDAARGNPLYLAPELLEHEAADARTDLYALGLIVSAMLLGKPLNHGLTLGELVDTRLNREVPDPEALDQLPPALSEPLRRCVARDPASRFASVSELAAALVEATAPETAAPTQLTRERDVTPHSASLLGRTTASSRAQFKALAVLPFRFRGPKSESYVADALLDELTDVLSMTRGLRVSGSGATARFTDAGDRDPRLLGTELAVDVVVDGSIQLAGKRLRIAARLLDVHTGFQLWSERFDGELGDVFDLQDKLGQRIAEALRVELEIISHGGLDDPEALESYLRARQAKLYWRMGGPDGAVAHYRRVLERAPDFRPAIAGIALALMRGWFMPGEREDDEHDWASEAKLAVERAMLEAPDFPESRIAMASWLVQAGDYRGAAEHLREALRIAPTCALAHEYLGRLQTEAAQPGKGLRHLELALELDPALVWCHADIARYRALQGDLAGYREHMQRLLAQTDRLHVAAHLLEMRVGAWFRDLEQIRRGLAQIDPNSSDEAIRSMRAYGPPLLQPYDPEALASLHAHVLEGAQNGRLRTLLFQLWAEQSAFWSDRERTLAHLEASAALALVDLAWLDGCPLFDFVRDDPRFVQLRARVRQRCEAIWGS